MPFRSLVRILLVDDFGPFRRFISQTLQMRQGLAIVGEAAEGLEAVQKAQELRPDLILLDIGLPKLNGIEAAHRIREVSPESKIVFVTQESSAEIAKAALGTGARGYVPKSDAGRELVPAIQAVLNGEVFISSSLAGQVVVSPKDRQPMGLSQRQDTRCHEVAFWPDDASLVHGYSRFIENSLEQGNAVIFVATESHRNSVLQRLKANGIDVCAAMEKRNYIPLDVADLLSAIMIRDVPDPVRLTEVAGNLIAQVRAVKGNQRRVSACGECAPTLLAQGKAEAAIQLEHLWDETVVRGHDVNLLCGYSSQDFQGEESRRTFERVCAEHSAVHTD